MGGDLCMATADQIKSLVKAYVDRNDEKFKTVSCNVKIFRS